MDKKVNRHGVNCKGKNNIIWTKFYWRSVGGKDKWKLTKGV